MDQLNEFTEYQILNTPGLILPVSDTATNAGTIYAYIENRTTPSYNIDVSVDGENNFTIPFTIKTGASVFFEGQIIKESKWSGEGTTTLTISAPTYKHNIIIVKND